MRESYQDRKALPFVIILGRSYNLPKFCASTTWYPQAVTFANETTVGTQPVGLFVNTKNSVYVAARTLDLVQVWLLGTSIPSSNISGGLNQSLSVFVTIGGEVYVDNSVVNGRVDKWALNATSSVPAMYVNSTCYHIFVNYYDDVYCSLGDQHRVVRRLFIDSPNITTTVAGNGNNGSASNMLCNPRGIFIVDLYLYIADSGNDRIQRYQFVPSTVSTVAGNGAEGTINLVSPHGVIVDGDEYLFIADLGAHRIIGSGPNGFRCIAGCSGINGSASNQLNGPTGLNFDSNGNLVVVDSLNNRIQKFMLANNLCGKCLL